MGRLLRVQGALRQGRRSWGTMALCLPDPAAVTLHAGTR